MQCRHRCSADRRRPLYAHTVVRPAEVPRPRLEARIEERNRSTRVRIDRLCLVAPVGVANSACQPEIRYLIAATVRQRNTMLDFQTGTEQMLRSKTVAASVPPVGAHLLHCTRNGGAIHCGSSSGGCRPRESQRSAPALCAPSPAGTLSAVDRGASGPTRPTYLLAGAPREGSSPSAVQRPSAYRGAPARAHPQAFQSGDRRRRGPATPGAPLRSALSSGTPRLERLLQVPRVAQGFQSHS
jgi:hypothetical protein